MKQIILRIFKQELPLTTKNGMLLLFIYIYIYINPYLQKSFSTVLTGAASLLLFQRMLKVVGPSL